MCVYLIHFSDPLAHAQHYIGYSADVDVRIDKHHKGRGSRIVQVALERGLGVSVVRIWHGADRTFERKLKNRKKTCRMCPVCNPEGAMKNGRSDTYPSERLAWQELRHPHPQPLAQSSAEESGCRGSTGDHARHGDCDDAALR